MFKILVVEDDRDLNRTVCSYLMQQGYTAVGCLNAQDAYDALYKNMFDLIVSDIMMPGIDGFEFARTVRELNQEIPILFMSARDDLSAKQQGFRAGVDDYMVKPIDLDELILPHRRAAAPGEDRRQQAPCRGQFCHGPEEHTAYLNEEELPLTAREFDLLYKLLSYPKKTFTRTQLMDEFWDADTTSGSRTVDVYITKLRDKLSGCDDFEIVTVRGLGYKAVLK